MTATAAPEPVEPPLRRDRDGSYVLAEPAHHCWGGWKGYGMEGQPIPCLTCKPHLVKRKPDYTDPFDALQSTQGRPPAEGQS